MLWDARAGSAVWAVERSSSVTVVELIDEKTALVADAGGVASIVDLRAGDASTTLLEPSKIDADTRARRGAWEGERTGALAVASAAIGGQGAWIALLRGADVFVFDATTFSLSATLDVGDGLDDVRPSCLAATRLPAGGR